MLMNNSDLFYNEPIRPSSSSTFTSSPTKSMKNVTINIGNADKDHILVGNSIKTSNKDLSKTGQKSICKPDFDGSLPPPPPHLHDIQSQDTNYHYASIEKNPKYQHQNNNQNRLHAKSNSPQNRSQGQSHKKNSIHKNSQKDSRRENQKVIERNKYKNEVTEDKDWMPMRQLFNAHKL